MSYRDTVLPIIRETRTITLPSYGSAGIVKEKSAHPADIVTELDGRVEQFLSEKLAVAYPDIAFVGEENGGDRTAERFWLVDPIDGTGHYLRGLPFCTTMLALIEHGVVTFSVVYDFVTDTMYWAERGQGAYKNNERIQVSKRTLEQSYLCVESDISKRDNKDYFFKLDKKIATFHSVSAGWEFAMVACGKMDGRVMFDAWGNDYDYAPGSLLVEEAGGIVTNINSTGYDYKNTNLIAANPKVYSELAILFKDYKQGE